MFVRIWNVIIKELIQFARDRLLTGFILLAPVLQLLLMAQNVERGISEQPVAILDLDRSRLSRQLIVDLDNSDELQVQFYVDNYEQIHELLDGGDARLAVVIPAGFAERLLAVRQAAARQVQVQLFADGTNTMAASVTLSAAGNVLSRFSADLAVSSGLMVPEIIDFRTNIRFNPTMDIRDYTIPAQLGFIIYQVTLAVAALGLARERELGTLEQLMVTPLRHFELTLGKGLPAIAIGGLNFGVMWIISLTVFDTPMNGSPLLLIALSLLFITTQVGWGLVLSAISRTQQQAILFVFIQAMVDVAFSGFLVPVKNMPEALQMIARFVPLQHYLAILRSVMLKGAGLEELWRNAAALAILGIVMWGLGLRAVARQVD
ncbi:MAG: ABC transporter permease [Anaerolineae bacterium]|nr:ABC transporter permease [Anaerolineae bacterium]